MRLQRSTISRSLCKTTSSSGGSPLAALLSLCLVGGAIGAVASSGKNAGATSPRYSAPSYRSNYSPTAISPSIPSSTSTKTTVVYVTATGSKYHAAGCQYLRLSSTPMDLEEAERNYSPCSVCQGSGYRSSASEGPTAEARGYTSSGNTDGVTPTGKTIYVGPRGGRYHYSSSGKKVYEKRRG